MFSPPYDLLDYIKTSHFCHAADEGRFPSLIWHDCDICTEYIYIYQLKKVKKLVFPTFIYTFFLAKIEHIEIWNRFLYDSVVILCYGTVVRL
jgi:hypothetical protein